MSEIKATKKVGSSKSSMVVALRNKFFLFYYKYATLVFIASVVSFAMSVVFMIFFARQPVEPQYVPTKEDGTYFTLEALTECKSDTAVQKFVIDAVKKLYKYDYVNYADQIQDAAQYFTVEGWNEYLDEYSKSNILQAVKENQWVSTIDISTVPEILKKNQDGVNPCTWDVRMGAIIIYAGQKGQRSVGTLYVKVTRNSVINNPEGLGIYKVIHVIK